VKKRVLAAVLWFAALSSLGGFAEVFFGVPSDFGGYLGVAAGILVMVDGSGYAWGKRKASVTQMASVRRTS
jgi:hypothetical protein